MKRVIKKVSLFLLGASIAASVSVSADTGSKVNDWFNNMNYSNVTKPGVYEGQSARYYTLGGVSTRGQISRPFNFVNIQTPKFSAGCGGIDMFAGGFSAVNADALTAQLRAIGQNAESLAYMLAIQIVSSQLSGVMETIEGWANTFNKFNMDSCEAATAMVGGALDIFGADEGSCTVKRMSQFGEDWTTANNNCTTGGKRQETQQAAGAEIAFSRGNLAWYVLMQDPFFKTDTQFAEMVMNITGTLIVSDAGSDDDDPIQIRVIEPAITDVIRKERFENIYAALLYGRQATQPMKIYRCQPASSDPNSCMTATDGLQDVAANWDGMHKRIEDLVKSIVSKIYSDTALDAQEKGLIATTSIPLYRYLAATAAYFPKGSDVSSMTRQYTELIAEDILIRSLQSIVETVEQSSSNLKDGMGQSKRVQQFREDLERVMQGLAEMREKSEFDIEQYFVMQQRIQLYEKALIGKLGSGMVTSALWGQ